MDDYYHIGLMFRLLCDALDIDLYIWTAANPKPWKLSPYSVGWDSTRQCGGYDIGLTWEESRWVFTAFEYKRQLHVLDTNALLTHTKFIAGE